MTESSTISRNLEESKIRSIDWIIQLAAALGSLEFIGGLTLASAKIVAGFMFSFLAPYAKKYVILTSLLESVVWTSWIFARRDAFSILYYNIDYITILGVLSITIFKKLFLGFPHVEMTYFEAVSTALTVQILLSLLANLTSIGFNLFLVRRFKLRKRSGICLAGIIDRSVAERPATLVLAVLVEARKRLLASPL